MSLIRSFVHWYVWWGCNAFYYYSRPFAWAWSSRRAADSSLGEAEQEHLELQERFFRAHAKAFQRDVVVAEREYMRVMEEVHKQTEESVGISESILEANKESARLEWGNRP